MLGYLSEKSLARKQPEPIRRRVRGQEWVRVQKEDVDGNENMEGTGGYVKEIGRLSG
jgi:hypothetical protein